MTLNSQQSVTEALTTTTSEAGRHGPRPRNDPWSWVAKAARLVAAEADHGPCSPEVLRHLQAAIRVALGVDTTQQQQGAPGIPAADGPRLTARESATLVAIAEGKTNAQIARDRSVSEDTVKSQVMHLMRKIGAVNRANVVTIGFRNGVLR